MVSGAGPVRFPVAPRLRRVHRDLAQRTARALADRAGDAMLIGRVGGSVQSHQATEPLFGRTSWKRSRSGGRGVLAPGDSTLAGESSEACPGLERTPGDQITHTRKHAWKHRCWIRLASRRRHRRFATA